MTIGFLYGIILLFIAVILLGFEVYILINPKENYKTLFRILLFVCFLYTLAQGIVFVSSNETVNFFCLSTHLVTYPLMYALWYVFIANYTEDKRIQKKKYVLCVLSIPIISFIGFIFTFTYSFIPDFNYIGSNKLFFVNLDQAYAFIMSIVALIFIYLFSRKKGHRYRDILITLSILPFIPLCTSLARTIFLVEVFNFSPVIFFIVTLICIYLIYVSNITEINPYSEKDFIENVNMGIIYVDASNTIIEFNKALDDYLNTSSLSVGVQLNELLQDIGISSNIKNFFYENRKYGEILDNKGRWIEITRNRVIDHNEFIGNIYTLYDITALKETEQHALKSQKETEEKIKNISKANDSVAVLLDEVNHRVKNNLQLILSFINLDKKYKTNPKEILDNAIKRVSSMALVYDNTYHEDQYAAINISDFIKHTTESFIGLYSDGSVKIIYDLDDSIRLPIDTVTPLSLILNELLTNCYKHAFKDFEVDEKKILITFKHSDANHAYLIIADNGKGLPKDIDITNTGSLGVTIVKNLTKQIKGEYTILEAKGAAFKIEFPLD